MRSLQPHSFYQSPTCRLPPLRLDGHWPTLALRRPRTRSLRRAPNRLHDEDLPYIYHFQAAFRALLDPSETVIACSPYRSVFTENAIPPLPSQSLTTECATQFGGGAPNVVSTIFSINRTTASGSLLLPPSTQAEATPITTIFTFNDTTKFVAVTQLGPLYLFHKSLDLESEPTGVRSDSSDTEDTPTNAASTFSNGADFRLESDSGHSGSSDGSDDCRYGTRLALVKVCYYSFKTVTQATVGS
ncbi:hypothetical protein BDV12DRAFT_203686 [Aspergillus spectabilis]